ncbi:MAG: helix-turn-helix domain-containing protein [Chloroflexi bacterium]|uniref:helix-turn-helix domain-containing protein n=1 Tax=Candidatus Flexifilum breve TaxID=3140694 RepID=UPI0031364FD6|nr:helix-turn-helix domain-containing protein [Chloroflexota bacterium]
MSEELGDLVPVPEAARRAGVARNTLHLAAKNGTIKAVKIGRDWFVYASDLERWKNENYRPDMAHRYPVKNKNDTE